MAVLVTLLAIVLALLALLVAGLLRSHAEILRELHGLGVDMDPARDDHDHGSVTTAVDDPDAPPRTRLGHRRHRRLQLGVLADEVRRRLGVEDAQQRYDGGVLVLHRDHLAQPVAVGAGAGAAIAYPRQGLHLLGVGLGDVGDVEDQKGALPDAARARAAPPPRAVPRGE